ncbi:MAG: hypothetical protein Q9160_003128 [Pyrenula sp. 1 TL-2023]
MSQSYSKTSYTSYSSSSTSSIDPNSHTTTTQRYAEESYTDPTMGTTTRRAAQTNNEPPVSQTVSVPPGGGRATITGYGGQEATRRIEDVSERDEQAARDRDYEEKIEDE